MIGQCEPGGADIGAVTRVELCQEVHRAIGFPKTDCAKIVDSVLGQICEALGHGEMVKLSGFGTFVIRSKSERLGRNPKTGEMVPIAGRRVLSFRASQQLRARLVQTGPR